MGHADSCIVRWALAEYGDWKFHLAATDQGLCYVGSQGLPKEEMLSWINKAMPGCALIEDTAALEPYVAQFRAYLEGSARNFSVPLDSRGTDFQKSVWDALMQIPYGHTVSYSDIASKIGRPAAVRAVGTAIGANPILITIPCHRVVGKRGALTGYRGGLAMKTELLALERTAENAWR
ncbi:methylated-DNA-[protein]-cysteine S-methyltransferase [Paenibacillus phyllosphaerae]|uniref:methylated-DNA--[protein]-cysteine S-methyltransferase n=1 Tax=Paenibacillus phyllosphaerae TaxID=274593 RepID=A0A7W5AYY3_9BACL|nr:methylated-DNA--[protein]-cysteine S-methyltransferase [Paenibacillus phyllosphaerae]MBB3111182.1 methylated-DNA-[protein]-cysteine S-methyltransferase [Paenibacillus phyllosphaerae]